MSPETKNKLFEYFANNHNKLLLPSDFDEIEHIVNPPVKIKIVNKSNNPNPDYGDDDNSGMDLRAFLHAPVELGYMERAKIPTGIYIEIPSGLEGQVRPKSGKSEKGFDVCWGTLDACHRGDIKVTVVNNTGTTLRIESGNKLAQLVIAPIEKAEWVNVEELSPTKRGEKGHGSTGE